MRKKLFCAQMMTVCLLLAGCAGPGASDADAMAIGARSAYLSMQSCSGQMKLTADYGQRVYRYTVDFACRPEDETVLTIREPEELAGISVRLRDGGSELVYDSVQLETGTLENGISPVGAFSALLNNLREGYIAQTGFEESETGRLLRLDCCLMDEAQEAETWYGLWLDAETNALVRGEISCGDRTVIRCDFKNFEWE